MDAASVYKAGSGAIRDGKAIAAKNLVDNRMEGHRLCFQRRESLCSQAQPCAHVKRNTYVIELLYGTIYPT